MAKNLTLLQDDRAMTPTTKRLLEDQKKKPLIKLSKCGKCSAVGIYIIGFILLVLSLGMFAFGMEMQTNPSFNNFILLTLVDSNVTPATAIQQMNFTYATSPWNIIAIFCTFFGGFLTFVGMGSIIGACVRHKCILGALVVYLCIILGLSFIGLFFTLAFVNLEVTRMLTSIILTCQASYGSLASITDAMNFVQYYFNCCGVVTNTDIFINSSSLPNICCSNYTSRPTQYSLTWFTGLITATAPNNTVLNSCSSTTLNPCYTTLSIWMQPLVIAGIVVFFLLEVGLLVLVIFLFQSLKSRYRVTPAATTTEKEIKSRSKTGKRSKTARSKTVLRKQTAQVSPAYAPVNQYDPFYPQNTYGPPPSAFVPPPAGYPLPPPPQVFPGPPQSAIPQISGYAPAPMFPQTAGFAPLGPAYY